MNIKIITTGRTDIEEYFKLSGIRECTKLSHHPFIVFLSDGDAVNVEIISDPRQLIELPPSTKVMAQWGGQWRSDFFQFTVEDFLEFIKKNPRKDHHII